MHSFHYWLRHGFATSLLLTGVVLLITPATEAGISPDGWYKLNISLDGHTEEERQDDWPQLPAGYKRIVSASVDRYTRTSPEGEPEIDRKFTGSVLLASGDRPQIQLDGYSIHHGGFGPGIWNISAEIKYYFDVYKKVPWAPDGPVPIQADAYVVCSVGGSPAEHGATGSARVTIPGTSALTIVEAVANWSNPDPAPFATASFDVMPETATEVHLYATAQGLYEDDFSHESVRVIADPCIQIDWSAIINVGGTDYYATELYDVAFSPGFTDASSILIPGDANYDYLVNEDDAAILADNWQTLSGATWSVGDFNGNYAVNDVDAAILAANWQSVASDAVPEPGTLTLSAICGLMLLGLGDRRRKR